MFECRLTTDGAAFRDIDGDEDEFAEAEEITSILAKMTRLIAEGSRGGAVMDTNGNKVGDWRIT